MTEFCSQKNFYALTTFFNPAKYKNKYGNYKKFRESSKRQGLNLIAVELSFNGEPFELQKDDAEIVVQVRSNSVMWQKERLLNIGLKHLPPDCDKVAWIDCDILFQNDNWIQEASDLLDKYNVIQLFSFFVNLPKQEEQDVWNMPFGIEGGQFCVGMAKSFFGFRKKIFAEEYLRRGVPGGAWAARREIIEQCGFFDRSVFGTNDTIQTFAFLGGNFTRDYFSVKLNNCKEEYSRRANNIVNKNCYYLDNVCLHLWHGDFCDRKYDKRENAAKKFDFDPKTDIKINSDGAFEWASDKPELHKAIKDYFYQRREEENSTQDPPGTFWAITTFFNPAKYKNKYENYKKFRESSKRQGLKLIAVELAFNGEPFELQKDDAEIVVQVRSNSVMWQKERLLNTGLKHLPPDCDKVAWLDCDILFQNDNWIQEASELLDKYNVIQLFSFFVNLPKIGQIDLWGTQIGAGDEKFNAGFAYKEIFKKCNGGNFMAEGHPGFAWAARREVIEQCGFFDKAVFGSGDDLSAYAFLGLKTPGFFSVLPQKLVDAQKEWARNVFKITRGNCHYLNNICMHLWHGSYSGRKYLDRHKIAKEAGFDPFLDLKNNEYGVFEWASQKPNMHKKVEQYFFSRQECAQEPKAVVDKKLSGSLWGITTFFNPVGLKNKYENYKKFRESSKKQGLKFIAVELSFGRNPFELSDEDADIVIHLRAEKGDILWQKEAMLNVGLKNLPSDCDKVVWLDCDIIFLNNNWVRDTSLLLEKYAVVQPFEMCCLLGQGMEAEKTDINKMPFGVYNNSKRYGLIYTKENFYDNTGHPGFAWAARREILDKIGFYDRAILCVADSMMAYAFYNFDNYSSRLSPAFAKDYKNWIEMAAALVGGSIYYSPGVVAHLWHGSYEGRLYEYCFPLLKKFNFDPVVDVKKDSQGIWEWSSGKKAFHSAVLAWFKARNEEGRASNFFLPLFLFFLKIYPNPPRPRPNAQIILLVYQRPHNLEKILRGFSAQTYKNFEINILNNNAIAKSDVEKAVEKFPGLKINLRHSEKNLGSKAKFDVASKTKGNPLIFIDDDMIPDKNFVEYMVGQYEKYGPKSILGWHAFQFMEDSYLNNKKQPDCGDEADFVGSGSMVLDRSVFENIPEIFNIPENAQRMEDIWFSFCARDHGFKLIKIGKKVSHEIDGLDQWENLKEEKEKLFLCLRQSGWELLRDAEENNLKCPACGLEGGEFLPFGIIPRKNAQCPRCGSLERHRLAFLYLRKIVSENKKVKFLHLAPEKCLADYLISQKNVEYLSVDLNMKSAMRKEDITNLSFGDSCFDIIFCSHVLEHVIDDKRAMSELFRILKPGGQALVQCPVENSREETFENFSITTPEERLKVFGQQDHVRIYGRDFKERLKQAGFIVKILFLKNREQVKKFSISPDEAIYLCVKPSQPPGQACDKIISELLVSGQKIEANSSEKF